jgi:membrane-bound lytic murein transglycosylase MltF
MRIGPQKLVALLAVASAVPAYFAATCDRAGLPSEGNQPRAAAILQKDASQSTASLELSLTFERHVGDLDGMKKRHLIRVLVVPSHSGFFYANGHPQGVSYEAFDEFQRFANQKLKTGSLRINVTYIPVRPEQLENALLDGVGDVIGYGVIVTPEREQKVLFTAPIETNVKQVIVTGPKAPAIATLEDSSGKEIYANPLTVYYENLQHLSEAFQRAGRPPILVKAADPNLTDEDLREMVTAGLIPATVTINIRADFWSKVYPHLTLCPSIVLKEEGQLAFATRKDSPQLRQLLEEFVQGRQMGTSLGSTLIKRYLQNTKWVRDATSSEEINKFRSMCAISRSTRRNMILTV